jgi:iron complex transport system substrate-binding protein
MIQTNASQLGSVAGGLLRLIAVACLLAASCLNAGENSVDALAQVSHARHFAIEGEPGLRTLILNQPVASGGFRQMRYLVGAEKPAQMPADTQWIQAPVERLVVLSTTLLAFVDVLDALDHVVGIASLDYPNSPRVRERILAGKIQAVGGETDRNVERLLATDAQLLFLHALGDPERDVQPALRELGMVCCFTYDYLEPTALARAEWVKVMGLLLGKEAEAARYFAGIEARYLALRELASQAARRPLVFANAPWGNVWYMPGGGSFVASLIADAGGDYLWKELPGAASSPLDFEAVYAQALDADCWINTGYLDSVEQMHAHDPRYGDFKALKERRAFSETRRVNDQGGNDIWESGVVHPDWILADLIKAFHPDLMPEHTWVFYRRLK